jgi:hypothetical protein
LFASGGERRFYLLQNPAGAQGAESKAGHLARFIF